VIGSLLITGGTGYLGRGILRRAQSENWPAKITVLSRDETKQDECRKRYPDVEYVLGDICDSDTVDRVMRGKTSVIHTAAMKYVPDAEFNVAECIRVNVEGLENVLHWADWYYTNVVFVSTDKAVQPINVYGMTKALGERLVCESSKWTSSKFNFTRYGNVLCSTGSVIPYFKKQLATQGEVTVTNPYMTRFWLTIDEAVDLVLEAFAQPTGVGVIPKARAMRIGTIASVIAGDKVRVIGARPGEKMDEDLIHLQESVRVQDMGSKLYYYLNPVGSEAGGIPFQYTSSNPHEWLTCDDLLAAIEDAETV
jgi:UDP-N-acetylglucosamine 4,6-dehydratase